MIKIKIFLLVYFASFFILNKANTTIQNNVAFATFPSTETDKRYKFDEEKGFEDWRKNQVISILESEGSTQSNDVIQFEEYKFIIKN
ncbi:hypothetical protein Mgra_00006503, partial [Meloidogyne graminicola]